MMEFHVSKAIRDKCLFDLPLFSTNGNVILANFKNVRLFAQKINDTVNPVLHPEQFIKAGQLNAMGLIDEIFHVVCSFFRKMKNEHVFIEALANLEKQLGKKAVDKLLREFTCEFPPLAVYTGEISEKEYLEGSTEGILNRVNILEEMMLLHLANENPAFTPFYMLFNDANLAKNPDYAVAWQSMQDFFKTQPLFGPNNTDLITMLREPVIASPHSLKGQLDYIRHNWAELLGEWLLRLLAVIDMIAEEEKPGWSGHFSGPPPMEAYNYDSLLQEYERFSPDRDWMPRVVLMAKTVLVWLDQLSKAYDREITHLDDIPDEELDNLAQEGFTGLWLIGLWERSWASKRIKQINGNPEATSSAYSLHDYEIAENLGGWDALDNLRRRLWYRGIRLASDMVPNHTAMDSKWVAEKPHLFIQGNDSPFPSYSFNGENLSIDPSMSIFLEDRYYSKSDCAVVYKRVDNTTGKTCYIYHGNDGTGMPWNDTAQIDFLNAEAREEVIQKILHVAKNFSIIRFDAAMVLAKKHIRRLWFPEQGQGGDIASRAEHAITNEAFEAAIPNEFWREVVDRIGQELPDTLLLAEAFWMMEGYFVRTLGMHRVYNSAFMNMLKKEENDKYRETVKNTLEFDPQVLKRFVNFMNNPDEETAVAQFGKSNKYFGVCTLMVTMPGLPMFGHGQIEGFTEKYGMEYTKAYWDEEKDYNLIERHKHDIFPLMKKRYLFAEIENFRFYDVWSGDSVNENVFAYSNRYGTESAIVFYNNIHNQTEGWIKTSCRYMVKDGFNTMQTQDIASAIGLTNSTTHYCIFQEQKSSLWYICSSSEIYEKGMYLHLTEFEYQVLINITEVEDDNTGMYHILYKELAGRGVQDIDVALKEVFLKDLYGALKAFASPEFFNGIATLCVPQLQPKVVSTKPHNKAEKDVRLGEGNTVMTTAKAIALPKILANSKEAGLEYFKMLKLFIDGNYGSSTIIPIKKTETKFSPETIWKNFSANITKLVQLCNQGRGSGDEYSPLVSALYGKILEHPFMSEILTGFCILFSVKDVIGSDGTSDDTKKLIQLWCLERKIRDILVDMGKPSRDMYEQFRLILEVTQFCYKKIDPTQLQAVAWKFMTELLSTKSTASILDVNMYDGILWFNREKAEEATWLVAMLITLFDAKPAAYPNIKKTWDILEDAIKKSEYKAEEILRILKPVNLEEKSTVKKSSMSAKGKEKDSTPKQ